jgi:hypothetical protein
MESIGFSPTLGKGHFDPDSPLSLYAKLGKHWAGRFMGKLAELGGVEEYLADEAVLADWLFDTHKYRPNDTDHRYRLQFWLEYENSCKLGRQMNMANVYNLVGPEATFHHLVMKDARRVAWMLSKPVAYEMNCREILNSGLSRWKKLLSQDPFQPDPKDPQKIVIDYKLIDRQTAVTKLMDLRLNGAPTQNIRSLELKATLGANGELQAVSDQMDADSIERRLQELRKRKLLAEGRAPKEKAAPPSEPETIGTPAPTILDAEVVGEEG